MKDQKISNVPLKKVAEIVNSYALDGSYEIIAKKTNNGLWEITAKFKY